MQDTRRTMLDKGIRVILQQGWSWYSNSEVGYFAGSGLQPEPLVNVLRSFVNPLVQSARLNQPQKVLSWMRNGSTFSSAPNQS